LRHSHWWILHTGLIQRRNKTQVDLIREDRRREGLINQQCNHEYLAEAQ
jgi:hypothetical protein